MVTCCGTGLWGIAVAGMISGVVKVLHTAIACNQGMQYMDNGRYDMRKLLEY